MLTVAAMVNTNLPSPSTEKSNPSNSLLPTKMASDQHSLFNDRIITQTALHYQAQPNVIPLPENSNENPMLGLLLLSEAAMQRAKDSNKTQDSSGTNKVKAKKIVRKEKPTRKVNTVKKAKRLPRNSTASNPKETKDDVCTLTDTNQACGKQFSEEAKLIAQMKIHDNIKHYICDLCSKKFQCLSSLNRHKKNHNNERTHTCTICNKKFISASILKQHTATHSSEKPFLCDLCNKRFLRKDTLKQHTLAHSKNKHTCYICKETFIKSTHIIKHMATMHDNKKAFACNLCDKRFTKYSNITAHKRRHTNAGKDISATSTTNRVPTPPTSTNIQCINAQTSTLAPNKAKATKTVRKAKKSPRNSTARHPKKTKTDVCKFITNADTR